MDNSKINTNWLQNISLGIAMALVGAMITFFPKVVASVSFMIVGVIFLVLGATDAIASLKYKDNTGSWKFGLISGISAILVSAFFIVTYYVPAISNKITTEITLIVVSVWMVLRCITSFISIFKGKIKRKGSIISAFLSGLLGVCLFIFRDHWTIIQKYIGYILLVTGIILMVVGFYQRASLREKQESIERELEAEKAIEKENKKSDKLIKKFNKKKSKELGEEEDVDDEPAEETEENTEESSLNQYHDEQTDIAIPSGIQSEDINIENINEEMSETIKEGTDEIES